MKWKWYRTTTGRWRVIKPLPAKVRGKELDRLARLHFEERKTIFKWWKFTIKESDRVFRNRIVKGC